MLQESLKLDGILDQISTEMGVALYFSTFNCGVCVALQPKVVHLLSTEFSKIHFISIPSHQYPEIAAHFSVFSAPTLLVFLEGKEVLRKSRNMGIAEIEKSLNRPYKILTNS